MLYLFYYLLNKFKELNSYDNTWICLRILYLFYYCDIKLAYIYFFPYYLIVNNQMKYIHKQFIIIFIAKFLKIISYT